MDGGFKITAEDSESHPVTKWPGQWSQVSRCQISQLKISELHISLIDFQGWQSMCTVRCCQMSDVYNFGIVDSRQCIQCQSGSSRRWSLSGEKISLANWSTVGGFSTGAGHCDGPGDNIMSHEFTQLAVEHLNGFEDWLPYIITYTLMNHHWKWPTKPWCHAIQFMSCLAFCLLSCCCLEECISFRLPHEGRIWTVVPSANCDVPNRWFLCDLSWRFGLSVCIWVWACLIQLIL